MIPGSRRSTGEGNGYPQQYSCLENSTDRGAWRAAVHGIIMSRSLIMRKMEINPKCPSTEKWTKKTWDKKKGVDLTVSEPEPQGAMREVVFLSQFMKRC